MRFINFILLFFALFNNDLSFAQQKSEAFLVTIKNMSIHVISPEKKEDVVSVVIKNDTTVRIISELRNQDKVLKRFTMKAQSQKSIQLNINEFKDLFYVSVAPAFQAVELKFNEKPYEIPEKD